MADNSKTHTGKVTVSGFVFDYSVTLNERNRDLCIDRGKIEKLTITYDNVDFFFVCEYNKRWFQQPHDVISYEAMKQVLEMWN